MRCYRCGCDNSETVRTCPGCGLSLLSGSGAVAVPQPFSAHSEQLISPVAALEQALGYATMGERFLAFLCDASIEAVLISAFLTYYAASSLDFEPLKLIALWVIPWAYMTLSEFFFHRTIGKRLLRIQLRNDSLEPRYPSFFRILLRESVGKFLCGFVLGIGFMAGGWNDKKKTWADQMANTVVVRTGIISGRLKAVLALILICANLGLSFALTRADLRYRLNVITQLQTTDLKIGKLHSQIFLHLSTSDPRSATEYQHKVAALPSLLDQYDRLLSEEQGLLSTIRKSTESKDFSVIEQMVNQKVIAWRQQISALLRKHVEKVLTFDSQKQTWEDLLLDRRRVLDDIDSLNKQINEARRS